MLAIYQQCTHRVATSTEYALLGGRVDFRIGTFDVMMHAWCREDVNKRHFQDEIVRTSASAVGGVTWQFDTERAERKKPLKKRSSSPAYRRVRHAAYIASKSSVGQKLLDNVISRV